MNRSPRLLVVARDPGAASALVPVARAARADVVALEHAGPFFAREEIPFRDPGRDDEDRAIEPLLRELRPDVLVTGTSLKVERDAAWWSAARARGIPTIAVLDHWSHYAERFTARSPFDRLPDRIAVMDALARGSLIDLGCPPERVVVTGQPALDAVLIARPSGRASARGTWSVREGTWVVLFASEPIAKDRGLDVGRNERDALEMLLDAAAGMAAHVIVRLHPRESETALSERFPHIQIDKRVTPRMAIVGADTVVGMFSIFLLEAALAGVPVLSIQPWPGPVMVPGGHTSLVALARTAAETRAWLSDPSHRVALVESERLRRNLRAGFVPGATSRLIDEAARSVS